MIKLGRLILLSLMGLVFAISLVAFFINPRVRSARVLIYHRLVENGLSAVKTGFPRRKLYSPDAVYDYLTVLLMRPSQVFLRPYFDEKVEVDFVQKQENELYISLKSTDSALSIDKKEVEFIKKVVRRNFPIYRGIQVFLNGTPIDS